MHIYARLYSSLSDAQDHFATDLEREKKCTFPAVSFLTFRKNASRRTEKLKLTANEIQIRKDGNRRVRPHVHRQFLIVIAVAQCI